MATDAPQSIAQPIGRTGAARPTRGRRVLDSTRRTFIGATVVTLLASCSAPGARLLTTQSDEGLLLENGDRLVVS